MIYLNEAEVNDAYEASTEEADQWRIDYPQYERLADNGLLDDLDENLPEVNDGSLAASLFKLAKRVIRRQLGGLVVCLDREESWIEVLGNIEFKHILKNANSKATPRRKAKDAVRKAAIFGGQPIINLFLERGNYTGSDFIVPYAQDVKLEAGKDSDEDSDIIFWDVYYSKIQLQRMLETAKQEIADKISVDRANYSDDDDDMTSDEQAAKPAAPSKAPADQNYGTDGASSGVTDPGSDGSEAEHPAIDDASDPEEDDEPYNIWDVATIEMILKTEPKEQRAGNEQPKGEKDKGHKKSGYHFYLAWQRGVDSPFMLISKSKKKCIRQWVNPDPTGDLPCHYLYCYQDFINPYGIGIVKLAGGTQNVLDYMRQADVLATQLGLRPPKQIIGDEDQVDEDSLVYAQDANWYVGNAQIKPVEMANGVYAQLPNRISMYKVSLNQMIPTGDTSIGAGAGDPKTSKTPAGVQFQAANLSIDDEDFSENVDETFAAVFRSMLNTQFANMQGEDFRALTDQQRNDLVEAGLPFPPDELGNMSNKVKVIWDHTRATFDFRIDPTGGIVLTAQEEIATLKDTLATVTPQINYYLGQSGWKFNIGEAYHSMLKKTNLENLNEILTKMSDEEAKAAKSAPFPIIDPPQIRLTGQIPNGAMPAALQQGGVTVDPSTTLLDDQMDLGDIYKDPNTTNLVRAQIQILAGIKPDPATLEAEATGQTPLPGMTPAPAAVDPNATQPAPAETPPPDAAPTQEAALPAETIPSGAPVQQAETLPAGAGAPTQIDPKHQPTDVNHPHNQALIAADHIAQVMKVYNVDAHTAAAMLEAERQGFNPAEIVAALKRHALPGQTGEVKPSAASGTPPAATAIDPTTPIPTGIPKAKKNTAVKPVKAGA